MTPKQNNIIQSDMTDEQKKDFVDRWMIVYNSPDGKAWIHIGILNRMRQFQKELGMPIIDTDKGKTICVQ